MSSRRGRIECTTMVKPIAFGVDSSVSHIHHSALLTVFLEHLELKNFTHRHKHALRHLAHMFIMRLRMSFCIAPGITKV